MQEQFQLINAKTYDVHNCQVPFNTLFVSVEAGNRHNLIHNSSWPPKVKHLLRPKALISHLSIPVFEEAKVYKCLPLLMALISRFDDTNHPPM